jgi:hypothetical protein
VKCRHGNTFELNWRGNAVRYKSFTIQNFKGIKDATINLDGVGGAAVFALVGLNESGKTTVLEAIHSFSPESATGELFDGAKGIGIPYKDRVPRHLISTFTGDVSVTATVALILLAYGNEMLLRSSDLARQRGGHWLRLRTKTVEHPCPKAKQTGSAGRPRNAAHKRSRRSALSIKRRGCELLVTGSSSLNRATPRGRR